MHRAACFVVDDLRPCLYFYRRLGFPTSVPDDSYGVDRKQRNLSVAVFWISQLKMQYIPILPAWLCEITRNSYYKR
jgi:hypothetical protein